MWGAAMTTTSACHRHVMSLREVLYAPEATVYIWRCGCGREVHRVAMRLWPE